MLAMVSRLVCLVCAAGLDLKVECARHLHVGLPLWLLQEMNAELEGMGCKATLMLYGCGTGHLVDN